MVLGQRSVRSSLGVGVSEWYQRLAKTLLPTKGEGEKIVGAYAPYTPLSTRLQGIGTQNNARRAISKIPAMQ